MRLVSGVTGRGDEGIFCKTFLLVFNIERFLLFSTTFGAVNTRYVRTTKLLVEVVRAVWVVPAKTSGLLGLDTPLRTGRATHVYTEPRHHNPPLYPSHHRTPYTIGLIHPLHMNMSCS